MLRLESVGGMGLNEACAKGEKRGARWRAGRVCGEMLGGWRLKTGRLTVEKTGRGGSTERRLVGRPRLAAGRRWLADIGVKWRCANREGRRMAWRVGRVCGEVLGGWRCSAGWAGMAGKCWGAILLAARLEEAVGLTPG